MRLLGQVSSPFVRRVAVSLELLNVPFELDQLSVFLDLDKFREINPVVKAPTLVCDNGVVLMDSSLILQYIESAHSDGRTLWPGDPENLQLDMRVVGLALAASEKCVQLVYELRLRPEEARLPSWLERVQMQVGGAFSALEQEVAARPEVFAESLGQAAVSTAIAWNFLHTAIPGTLHSADYPQLSALSERLEATPTFQKYAPPAR